MYESGNEPRQYIAPEKAMERSDRSAGGTMKRWRR